jgi:hypothetical protein
MSIDFKGFKVYKADILPPNTIMVSADVYEKLTETPEQRQARENAFKAHLDRFTELMAARGLSPTGRTRTGEPNYQDLPKGHVPGQAFKRPGE